jgi:aldehyde dehydrogenase (NAD+)
MTVVSTEPYSGQVIEEFHTATMLDVEAAVAKAREAFKTWRKVSRVERADLFDKLAQLVKRDHEALKVMISRETGKNLNESHAEVVEALHMIQTAVSLGKNPCGTVIASELNTKDAYVMRKPKGVVAIISPWNFPLAIGSTWCAAPALIEGNTVVHKPSELTPVIAQMMADLYVEAGFPDGVYNIIHGDGQTGSDLVRDDVNVILFTGSAEVGQDIRQHCASTWHKTCSCEMGSKSAVITFADGDLDLAVDVSIASAFKLSGQRCVSSGRLLVQRSVCQEFMGKFVRKARQLSGGSPFDLPVPYYGPLISEAQVDRVDDYITMIEEDDHAVILVHRVRLDYLISPCVYTCEWADKPYLKEEIFGPVVAIIPFNDIDDAIRIYNDTEYGLALGVITDDYRKHRIIRDECDTGMLYINGGSVAAESHLPFGGVKKSGNGYKTAMGTVEAVTEEIAVTVNYEHGISWAQGMT